MHSAADSNIHANAWLSQLLVMTGRCITKLFQCHYHFVNLARVLLFRWQTQSSHTHSRGTYTYIHNNVQPFVCCHLCAMSSLVRGDDDGVRQEWRRWDVGIINKRAISAPTTMRRQPCHVHHKPDDVTEAVRTNIRFSNVATAVYLCVCVCLCCVCAFAVLFLPPFSHLFVVRVLKAAQNARIYLYTNVWQMSCGDAENIKYTEARTSYCGTLLYIYSLYVIETTDTDTTHRVKMMMHTGFRRL